MDEGSELARLQQWFAEANVADEEAIRTGLSAIGPTLWPAFSGQAAADLDLAQNSEKMPAAEAIARRRLLGEERKRREYPVHGERQHAL